MVGFKSFTCSGASIAGIEWHHMLKKDRHKDAANLLVYEQFYALAA
jgi:putative transposase